MFFDVIVNLHVSTLAETLNKIKDKEFVILGITSNNTTVTAHCKEIKKVNGKLK